MIAGRNIIFGDKCRRIPDNSFGKMAPFLTRRNIQQNIAVAIRFHIKVVLAVLAAFNVICFVCKRRIVPSADILHMDNELFFACGSSAAGFPAAGRTTATGFSAAGFTTAGFTTAGFTTAADAVRPRCRHNDSIGLCAYGGGTTVVGINNGDAILAGVHQIHNLPAAAACQGIYRACHGGRSRNIGSAARCREAARSVLTDMQQILPAALGQCNIAAGHGGRGVACGAGATD